jgi:ATP-dependent DNA helicase RecQ
LVRLGFLRQTAEKFSVLELTNEGREALRQRQSVTLTKPVKTPESKVRRAGEITCDELLFEKLRQLRKQLADERDVPAYIVFSDVALRQMARDYPSTEGDFARISGVGEKKLREFGAPFLAEIAAHLGSNPRQIFADDSFTTPPVARPRMNDTAFATMQAFRAGKKVEEIARERGLVAGTIYGHILAAVEAGQEVDLSRLVTPAQQEQIAKAFARTGYGNLTGAKELLGENFDYNLLRIYRAAKKMEEGR